MEEFHCSFCGKQRREVRKLISGPRVFICDQCVTLCNDILSKEEASERPKYPPPRAIVEELDGCSNLGPNELRAQRCAKFLAIG